MSGPGTLCVGLQRSVSGPSALCVRPRRCSVSCLRRSLVGARRSMCRGPARFVSGPALSMSGPAALRQSSSTLSVSGPGGLCVGGSAFSGALYVRAPAFSPALFVSGPGGPLPTLLCRAPTVLGGLYVGARRSLCRGLAGALCVGAQRSLCRSPALWRLCRALVLSVSGPGPALSVGVRRLLCTLSLSGRGLYVGPRILSVGARRSLCRGGAHLCRALFVSGPGAGARCRGQRRGSAVFSAHSLCWVPALFLCRGPAVSVKPRSSLSGSVSRPANPPQHSLCPGALYRSLCRGPAVLSWPALFVSGPGAPYVGARRSLSRVGVRGQRSLRRPAPLVSGPGALCHVGGVGARRTGALCVGIRRSLCRGPALSMRSGALCQGVCGAGRFLCRSSALFSALCVGARRSVSSAPAVSVSGPSVRLSGPGAVSVRLRRSLCRAPTLFLCRGPALHASGPGAPYVGVRRSRCRGRRLGPAVLSQDSLGQVPAVCVLGSGAFCQARRRSLCRPGALCSGPGALRACRGLARALAGALCVGPALCVGACPVPPSI